MQTRPECTLKATELMNISSELRSAEQGLVGFFGSSDIEGAQSRLPVEDLTRRFIEPRQQLEKFTARRTSEFALMC